MIKNIKPTFKNKIIINSLILMSFIILSLLSGFILLKLHITISGWDTQFHFRRIFELNESIFHGDLFPEYSFNLFHGSAVMTMYPYINLYPSAIIAFFVKSKILIVYLSFIFNIFITFVISFYSNKSYTKNSSNAYVFSIVYGLSNLLISYYFVIADLGISYTYSFLPLIIFEFLNIITHHSLNNWIGLSIGMTLLSFSHILNMIIISFILFIWLLINFKCINKKLINNIIKSTLLFLLLSSIIYLPILQLVLNNGYNINFPSSIPLHRISLIEFSKGIFGTDNVSTIGFYPTLTIFISAFFYTKFNKIDKQMYFISLLIIIFALFFPFEIHYFNFLDSFQQVYRLLIIPLILLSIIFSNIVTEYIQNYNIKILLIIFVILFSIFSQIFIGQYRLINSSGVNKISSQKEFNKMINEYYPPDDDYIPESALPMSRYVNHDLGFYNNYYKIKVTHNGYNTFNFSGKEGVDKLSLPIYAYNNEKLHIYLNDKPVNNYVNKNGLLTIDNIQGNVESNNRIHIKPFISPFKIIGVVLSILGWLFVLIIFIKKKLKEWGNKIKD